MSGIELKSGTTLFASDPLSISSNEMINLEKNGYHYIDWVFDSIKDFFCQTERVQAKKELIIILNSESSIWEFRNAFHRLRELAMCNNTHFNVDSGVTHEVYSITDSSNNELFRHEIPLSMSNGTFSYQENNLHYMQQGDLTVGNHFEVSPQDFENIRTIRDSAIEVMQKQIDSYYGILCQEDDRVNEKILKHIDRTFNLSDDHDVKMKQRKQVAEAVVQVYEGLTHPLTILNLSKKRWEENRVFYEKQSKATLGVKNASSSETQTMGSGNTGSLRPRNIWGYVELSDERKDIHIAFPYTFAKKGSIAILIHEASHKFANTWDHCYISKQKQYAQLPAKYRIDNADTYAELMLKTPE
ncbi:hypothetical protein [uncultured Shewanella sp.]|uniref:hypothetical protein n=1 Tax=uncultured Shewanella sp. TaxID=173975 RepID=UPI00262E9E44|nr:hypothetical protein [uncultured Shewanella sp.]